MSAILGIGKSALAAAQAGLATTGHNIANAATPGYSRQVVVQSSAGSQNMGSGYLGKGSEVVDVRRVYDDILAANVRSAQSAQSQAQTWYTQLNKINTLLSDNGGSLSPSLQEFFKSVQNLASYPNEAEARQSVLSTAQALASSFQSIDGQLREMSESVNTQISSGVTLINNYADQIAKLNDAIERAHGTSAGKASNDLLDQRDYAIFQLSKEIKTTIVQQGNSYSVFIGNGQPLVVGKNVYELSAIQSNHDPLRTTVGYTVNGETVEMAESSLTGGKLGGLVEFRSKSLDPALNSLGRIAIGFATSFNAQHGQGVDQTGVAGGNFFRQPTPTITPNPANSDNAPALVARISNGAALSIDDYQLEYLGDDNYAVTNLTTRQRTVGDFATASAAIGGVTIDEPEAANLVAGDKYLIQPTRNGASSFALVVTDTRQIAAAGVASVSAGANNTGTAQLSAISASGALTLPTAPFQLSYDGAFPDGGLTGFPAGLAITVTRGGTELPAYDGTTPVPYQDGDTISFGGISFTISGAAGDGDSFDFSRNAAGDNRNAIALGALQTAKTMPGGTTYQGSYAQLVSVVGNRTRELEVTSAAESAYLKQADAAMQAESGVNLDEEAAELMRYQQAYQAAARVMQTANQLFELLLTLGN